MPNIELLKKQLKRLDRSQFQFFKSADLGGSVDMPFETAFASLANTYLKDKAPGLQDYQVGFQLIDKNQENTKAIGVFGFKVGSQWLYAPVFFINGDLKGHELLYVKNQDLFVPLKENWLNYLLNRKPNILGHGVDKNLSRLGVLPPNLYQLARSPAKFASDNQLKKYPEWTQSVLPDFAHFASSDPLSDEKYAEMHTIVDLLKEAGETGVHALINTVTTYPQIGKSINDIYGEETINAAISAGIKNACSAFMKNKAKRKKRFFKKRASPLSTISAQASDNLSEKIAKVRDGITVISFKRVMSMPSIGATLDDNEKETLQAGRMVIKDKRDDKDVTIAYNIDIPQSLESPRETGLYEVLTRPGEFRKCLILFGPYSNSGRATFVTAIDVENKSWINTHQTKIWTKLKYEREVFEKWLDELPDAKKLSRGGLKVLVGPTGQGTQPFTVTESYGGDSAVYDVYFRSHAKSDRAPALPSRHDEYDPLYHSMHGTPKIVITKAKGRAIRAMGNEIIIPDGFKSINLDRDNECGCGLDSDPPAVLDLGSMPDLHMGIIKAGNLQQLRVDHTGTHVRFDGGVEHTRDDALVHLITNVGLREKQANDVLETARENKSQRFFLQYGFAYNPKNAEAQYDLQRSGPSAPPFPEPVAGADPMTDGQAPTIPPMEENIPVSDMQSQMYDRSGYDPRPQATTQPNMVGGSNDSPPDKNTMDVAMNAAQSGQREVFDTAMLGSLLKSVRDDSMIDKYMGDLMKGMDRLARILFLFYWHQDEFEQRYGKQELPELEDGLRNAFEAVGNIVLFLKQKTVEPYPDEVSDVELHSIAQ